MLSEDDRWYDLAIACKDCKRCRLAETRKYVVMGRGSRGASYFIVGEAPGVKEDELGVPFVGRAGKKLMQMLRKVHISLDDCYITNILQCWPKNTNPKSLGNNRKPRQDEVDSCIDWLYEKLDLVRPKVVICVGKTAASSLLEGTICSVNSMSYYRGRSNSTLPPPRIRYGPYEYPVFVTYHSAYVLRNPEAESVVLDDLRNVKSFVEKKSV